MVNKKLFHRSHSHNDLWDLINRSPSQRRLYDSRDPADALITLENQILGKTRSWSTSVRSKIHDSADLSSVVRDKSPYKLTEWIHGHQSKIETKLNPTRYRKIDIAHEEQDGFWGSDWSPQGRLDAYAAQRAAVEDGRRHVQESLERAEMEKGKIVQRSGTTVFANKRRDPIDDHEVVARLDSQVRSSPHAKVTRYYHIGSTQPLLR
jgi:hypothetical protein